MPRDDTVENIRKLIKRELEESLWEAEIISTNVVLGTVDVSVKSSGVLLKNIKVLETVAMNSITAGTICLIARESGGNYICLGTYSPGKAKRAGAEAGSILGIPVVKSEASDGYVLVYDTDNKQISLGDVTFAGVPALLSQFVTLATDSGLTNERVLTAGDSISITDGGAGSTVTIALNLGSDVVDDTNIDWGTGTNQVSAVDMPLADAFNFYTSTDVEGALQELGGGVSFSGGPPNFTYTTSNAEGSASTLVRTDASLAIFDATVPTTLTPGDSAAAGSAAFAARRDHVHGIIDFAAPGLTLGTSNVEGVADTFIRSDATILTFDATNPTSVDAGDSVVVGTATVAARRDHQHAVTSSSNPGAAASLIATDASGLLQLVGLGIGATPAANQVVFVENGIVTTGAGNLELTPVGDLILDPQGNDVLPQTNYDINLGAFTKKYLSLHAAELRVGTLVAADVLATVGGHIWVCPTTKLTSDLDSGDSTIEVEHPNLMNGDILHMEANGSIEFLSVDSVSSGSGPYTYDITRDLDGSGANDWKAGDAVVNTGSADDGSIELYAERSIITGTNAAIGPSIVGWQRQSVAFNDMVEAWAIGNLNGIYGKSSDTFGVALGPYTSGRSFTVIDDTGGIDLRNKNSLGVEKSLFNVAIDGDVRMGGVGASSGNFFWDYSAGKLQLRNNTTPVMSLDAINSQFSFGQDISASGQTALLIMGDAGTFNNEALGAGDVLFGDNTAFRANMLWDKSLGQLKFRGGTTDQVVIDANGQMTAGGGKVILDDGGLKVVVDTDWGTEERYQFVTIGGDDVGELNAYDNGTSWNEVRLKTSARTNQNSTLSLLAVAPAGYNPKVGMEASGDLADGTASVICDVDNTINDSCVTIYPIIELLERSADPVDPAEGYGRIWLSNGTGTGEDGDLIFERTAGGSTDQFILNSENLFDAVAGDYTDGVEGTDSTSYVTTSTSTTITLNVTGYITANVNFSLFNQDASEWSHAILCLGGTQFSEVASVQGSTVTRKSLSFCLYRGPGTYTIALYFKTGQTGGAYTAFVSAAVLSVTAFAP